MQSNKRYAHSSRPSKVRKRLDSVRQVGDENITANSEDHTQATGDLLSSAEGSYSQGRNYLLDPEKIKSEDSKDLRYNGPGAAHISVLSSFNTPTEWRPHLEVCFVTLQAEHGRTCQPPRH